MRATICRGVATVIARPEARTTGNFLRGKNRKTMKLWELTVRLGLWLQMLFTRSKDERIQGQGGSHVKASQ